MTDRGFKLIGEQVNDLKHFAANPKQRIPFGFRELDKAVHGPAEGEVFTVVARSGVGKSLFATNVMANNPDAPLIFFSLEMPYHLVLQRLYSHVFGTPSHDVQASIMKGKLPEAVEKLGSRLPGQIIVDVPGLSLNDMSSYIEAYEAHFKQRPALIVIDYLEEVEGAKQSGEGHLATEAVASRLKAWSRFEKVGTLSLHQTNMRTEPWEPPHQGSARGGGYTESDIVMGLWKPGLDPDLSTETQWHRRNDLNMNVIKNRIFGELENKLRYKIDPALRIQQLRKGTTT